MTASCTALLLHSFGSSGRSWAAVRERLAIPSSAPDLPGFGDAASLPHPSMAAYAEWALDRLRGLEGDVVLVGASMGGKVAMAAAALRPPNLRGLLLCAPSPPTPEPMEEDERKRRLSTWGDPAAAEESVAASTLAPKHDMRFHDAVEDWLRTDEGAWRWWWSKGGRETLDVAGVRAPTIVLAGDADGHLGAEVQRRETTPRLPEAQLRVVPRSGHLLALDRPDAVAEALEALTTGT